MKTSLKVLFTVVGLLTVASTAHALSSFAVQGQFGSAASTICPDGQAQDYTCLDGNGAIGYDGAVNDKKAQELRDKGACPCADGGGSVTTDTIPSDASDSQFDAYTNARASAAWGYSSVLVKAYSKDGKVLASKVIVIGPKGEGFKALRASIKAFLLQQKKGGATSFQFATGKPRN